MLSVALNDDKNITDNEKNIIKMIIKNPNISQKDIAIETNIPYRTVQRTISVLKDKGIIERVGSKKLGY